EMVRLAKEVNPEVEIAATRKTTPGLGFLEKMAVVAGGGLSHRFSLSDMILIKDNHIKILGGGMKGVKEAIKRAKGWGSFHKVEVEVSSLEEALSALDEGADIIMLDNFTPEDAERAYREIKRRRKEVIVEVSGGIRPSNVKLYAKSADIISSGYITHSAPSIDFTLEITEP
ncbi:MAG: carboxylating.nicotinate-nucleotide diphosphorylase, partial [Thermoplasmata archaeon]|nr:carboxylating.nicotinate-nucleotide diphosphorylase [Thermoplasmata archaeon]